VVSWPDPLQIEAPICAVHSYREQATTRLGSTLGHCYALLSNLTQATLVSGSVCEATSEQYVTWLSLEDCICKLPSVAPPMCYKMCAWQVTLCCSMFTMLFTLVRSWSVLNGIIKHGQWALQDEVSRSVPLYHGHNQSVSEPSLNTALHTHTHTHCYTNLDLIYLYICRRITIYNKYLKPIYELISISWLCLTYIATHTWLHWYN